jgi:hypothetical protein
VVENITENLGDADEPAWTAEQVRDFAQTILVLERERCCAFVSVALRMSRRRWPHVLAGQ